VFLKHKYDIYKIMTEFSPHSTVERFNPTPDTLETNGHDNPQSALEKYGFKPLLQAVDIEAVLIEKAATYGPKYAVGFHSLRNPGITDEAIAEYDDPAHRVAKQIGGLVEYGKGEVDSEGRCLSYCLWDAMQLAQQASRSKEHGEAVEKVLDFYQVAVLEMMMIDYSPEGITVLESKPLRVLSAG
jgi:hypothetical protein